MTSSESLSIIGGHHIQLKPEISKRSLGNLRSARRPVRLKPNSAPDPDVPAGPDPDLPDRTPADVHFGGSGLRSNNVTGVNKKEKEPKRKKMLLLQNTTLKD